ncbi:hypothetical protein Tco_1110702 [Tanacetum coccineum]|uniref:Uncharacterized protein n=1 Tax=Tanacetum coccineum TaxID=301880 RepID=A0ABQ5IJR8_9ASTR
MTEALAALEATLEIKKVPQKEKQNVNYYVDPYEPPILFPRGIEHHAEVALVHKTMESLKKIKINRPLLKEIRQANNYAKYMKDLVANKPRTEDDEEIRMNPRCSALFANQLPPKEQDPGSFILPCSIGWLDFNNALADLGAGISAILQEKENERQYWASCDPNSNVCDGGGLLSNEEKRYWETINDSEQEEMEWEELSLNDWMKIRYRKICKMTKERILKDHWREKFEEEGDDIKENPEDPKECGEDKANTIIGAIHHKLNDDWFNGTSEDEDDLEGVLDYLKPRSYNGFIDLDDEAYNKRRCRLLGTTYEEPPLPILIKKVKVTRYTVGPEEIYTKVKILRIDEMPRTRDNVASIRAKLMEKMVNEGNGQAKT